MSVTIWLHMFLSSCASLASSFTNAPLGRLRDAMMRGVKKEKIVLSLVFVHKFRWYTEIGFGFNDFRPNARVPRYHNHSDYEELEYCH